MRIVKLVAENFKKVRAVEITPKGEVVVISGRNGAGKSSILDAIWAALGGTKHIQAVPIRRGQERARIRLDLGELIVERRFTEKGSVLTVEGAQGARYTSPQSMLDALLGAMSFDPLAFVGQTAKEQFETLRRIVNLEVDVDELDALNRGDYERRTELNRQAKALRAQADGIQVGTEVPTEPIDTAQLLKQLADAAKTNADLETRRARREQAAEGVHERHTAAAELRRQAAELIARAEALDVEAAALANRLAQADPLEDPVDVDALSQELERAQALNKLVDQRVRKLDLSGQATAIEVQAQELTQTMEARAKVKGDAIAAAKMPVDGLGLGDQVVTFRGIPFAQASSAEQLRVSVSIAMAANPKLRVIRIKEGSLLDSDGLALIADMAKASDYQLWVERVDDTGKVGFYIEDGQVVAVDGEPVTEQPKPEPPEPRSSPSSSAPPSSSKPRQRTSPW